MFHWMIFFCFQKLVFNKKNEEYVSYIFEIKHMIGQLKKKTKKFKTKSLKTKKIIIIIIYCDFVIIIYCDLDGA